MLLFKATSALIKQIYPLGSLLLVNTNDRSIRVYSWKDSNIELLHKLGDLVDRQQWTKCDFGGEGEFVVASYAHKVEHNIFIWDRKDGQLIKILEGPKETAVDVAVYFLLDHLVPSIFTSSGFYKLSRKGLCMECRTGRTMECL